MYPSNLRTRTVLCTLACGLALAGCGGGDDSPGSGASASIGVDAPVKLEQVQLAAPALTLAFAGVEDSTIPGTMSKGSLQGDEHEFEIVDSPAHGSLRVT